MTSRTIDLQIVIEHTGGVTVRCSIDRAHANDEIFAFWLLPYLHANLESAAQDLILQMRSEAGLLLNPSPRPTRTKRKEELIRDLTSNFQRKLLKRLTLNRQLFTPIELKDTRLVGRELHLERTQFSKEFRKTFDHLRRLKLKTNKTNFARELFPRNSNPLLAFRRRLGDLGWHFEDVLDACKNSKPSG